MIPGSKWSLNWLGSCPRWAELRHDRNRRRPRRASLYLELVQAKVPAEIHIYEKGSHGYGLKAGNTLPGQLDWKARAIDWLRSRGW